MAYDPQREQAEALADQLANGAEVNATFQRLFMTLTPGHRLEVLAEYIDAKVETGSYGQAWGIMRLLGYSEAQLRDERMFEWRDEPVIDSVSAMELIKNGWTILPTGARRPRSYEPPPVPDQPTREGLVEPAEEGVSSAERRRDLPAGTAPTGSGVDGQ